MPVDTFGRTSDTKTKDTGVSLTYINNDYIRSDGSTPVTGSMNMNGNTLFNLPNPKNLQDVATKDYADKISSLLNESIIDLSNFYVILNKTIDENKEKIDKIQDEINEKVYGVVDNFLRTKGFIQTILSNERKIKEETNIILVNSSYKGRLNFGDYQFSFLENIIDREKSIGLLMPHSGYLKTIVLDTPFEKQEDFDDNMEYIALKTPLFEIVIEKKNIQKKKLL